MSRQSACHDNQLRAFLYTITRVERLSLCHGVRPQFMLPLMVMFGSV